MPREIVIIGFPKCGTTALVDCFEQDPDINVLRAPGGGMEIPWPMIRDTPPAMDPNPAKIQAHKYVAYAYNPGAIKYLVGMNPHSILALCVRDPVRSLISWHRMHRAIARKAQGTGVDNHFAWKERAFYSKCSISEYYGTFAKDRLRYDAHLKALLAIVPSERLVVVSQERIAQDIESVVDYLKALSADKTAVPPPPGLPSADDHVGYADRVEIALDDQIERELHAVQNRLLKMLETGPMHKCL